MWSDDIHKKMDDAGDSHYPAYDEKSWEKMEILLAKHLPEKKKKRRFIFLLFPLVLTGLGILFFNRPQNQQQPALSDKSVIVTTEKTKTETAREAKPNISARPTPTRPASPIDLPREYSSTEDKVISNSNDLIQTPNQEKADARPATGKPRQVLISSKHRIKSHPISAAKQKIEKSFSKKTSASQHTQQAAIPDSEATRKPENSPSTLDQGAPALKSPEPVDTSNAVSQPVKDSLAEDKTEAPAKTTKSTSTPVSKLTLNISFGPDLSSVSFSQPGQVQFQYGIGAAYQLSKRFSIRTGFFAGKKVYSADSTTYKTPYPIHNLEEVDATCIVYEIPVSLLYHFGARKKHEWFVSGGLSSYIMKKETYGYHYKNAWGSPQYYARTYNNENKHLFSVINLSLGYTYKFNERFSFSGEPYVKIPAGGVGVGKVKLNSAGVLFTLGYKPFTGRK